MNYKVEISLQELKHVEFHRIFMHEGVPTILLTFYTHQIECIRDAENNIIEGSPVNKNGVILIDLQY